MPIMSLLRIALKDFVIVKQLELDLTPGFTVLTGETGAGKSILIDALQLALGGRSDSSLIRLGQTKAEVTAEFSATPAVSTWLKTIDSDSDEATVLVRRTVDAQGRSRGWINSTPATAAQLKELGGLLLDIHGQHAWQALMRTETTRELIDEYGAINASELDPLWQAWKEAREALQKAKNLSDSSKTEREHLEWQVSELEKLRPNELEWTQLQEEHARLANVNSLLEGAQAAADFLTEADESVISLLNKASQQLAQRVHLEPQFLAMAHALEQASVLIEETARDIHAYTRHTEADPERLSEIDARIGNWIGLSKRHRCSPHQLSQHLAALQSRLNELSESSDLQALESRVSLCEEAYWKSALAVSQARHACAPKLAAEITSVMQQLGMKGGAFDVKFTAFDHPQSSGLEAVEFLVAGHAGTDLRPVAKVASGGELSRIALAIAVTTSQLSGSPTLIFDEVDSGIGGAVAHTVGKLMAELGKHRQVLAVTHLAQVASCADHHIKVAKQQESEGVISQVTVLDPEEREREIARMLGGVNITTASLLHAKEMLAS